MYWLYTVAELMVCATNYLKMVDTLYTSYFIDNCSHFHTFCIVNKKELTSRGAGSNHVIL